MATKEDFLSLEIENYRNEVYTYGGWPNSTYTSFGKGEGILTSCDGCKKTQDCSNWVKHNTTKGLTMWFQISYYCPACYEIIKYVVLEKFPN